MPIHAGSRTGRDENSLSLWALPPRQLVSTLVDMVESGTGGAAYYADVLEEIVRLAVEAPGGPPAGAADFLARMVLSYIASPGRWDLTDPEQVALLVRSELLAGIR